VLTDRCSFGSRADIYDVRNIGGNGLKAAVRGVEQQLLLWAVSAGQT